MTRDATVGNLRQQSALCDGKTPVELVSDDPELHALLQRFEVVRSYPDTVNAAGEFGSAFKIRVRRR